MSLLQTCWSPRARLLRAGLRPEGFVPAEPEWLGRNGAGAVLGHLSSDGAWRRVVHVL